MTAAPNPFSGRTHFEFTIPRAGRFELALYDISGRLVRRVVDDTGEAGPHRADWDGRDDAGRALPPGPYFYGVKLDGQLVGARKLTLLK
jgi:flagellar hook assembly protein FlgD